MLQLKGAGAWIRVSALGAGQTVAWGASFYSLALLLPEAGRSIGWSGSASAALFSVTLGCAAATAVPLGRWMGRHGTRPLLVWGSLAMGLALATAALVRGPLSLVAASAAIGFIQPALLYEPAFAAVTSWFTENRGRALTLVTIFGGLSNPVFVPITTFLVGKLGWRGAFVTFGGIMVLLAVAHAFIVPPGGPVATSEAGRTPPRPLRLAPYWPAALATSFVTAAMTAHWFPAMAELGQSLDGATLSMALLGGAQIPGRLLLVGFERRLHAITMLTVVLALHAAGMFGVAGGWIYTGAVVSGVAAGASILARAAALAQGAGAGGYARAAGVLTMGSNVMRAVAPWALSVIYALTRSYLVVLCVCAAIMAVAAVMTEVFRRDRQAHPANAG